MQQDENKFELLIFASERMFSWNQKLQQVVNGLLPDNVWQRMNCCVEIFFDLCSRVKTNLNY